MSKLLLNYVYNHGYDPDQLALVLKDDDLPEALNFYYQGDLDGLDDYIEALDY